MDQYTSSSIKSLLDEGVAGGKMRNDVLVIDVINLDDVVLIIEEEMIVERQPQGGKYMRDVRLDQGLFAPQGE